MFETIILQEYLNKLLLLVLGAEEADLKATLWSIPETNAKFEYASTSVNSHEEAIYSCIHYSVAPYFDAYVVANNDDNERNKKYDDNQICIPMTKKKINELELSFLHIQKNIEIPFIFLNIHPIIQKAIEKASLLGDIAFLNKLQSDVNNWIKEINKVIKLSRDPSSGTTIQEINFWLNKETVLEEIKNQIKSVQIGLTLDILGHAQRFHVTTSFANIGLKEAKEKDFPIGELLSAPDLIKIKESLCVIFAHFNKKMRITIYPIKKALDLVEAISRDLNDVLIRVLGGSRLMYMEYNDFEKDMLGAEDVFKIWNEMIKEFTNITRDIMRKRADKFIPIRIIPAHDKLQEHTTKVVIEDDAIQQENITINKFDFMEEINLAYQSIKDIKVLDISVDGTEIWMQAECTYNERVSRIENQIIVDLRDRLGKCKSTNEMFRVFSKFNALFVKPKIRNAIREYQNELIDKVKTDISKLYNKFSQQYYKSGADHMAQLRDLPTISGFMIWARQIEIQLHTYMKRIEDVLGNDWELYPEGQKLQIFEAWQTEISNCSELIMTGRLFKISQNHTQGNILQLSVNFDPQILTLFKEVRNLLWLNYVIPHNITKSANIAKRVYPFAIITNYRKNIQAMIAKSINFEWKYFADIYDCNFSKKTLDSPEKNHVTFVREFANTVTEFQYKVDTLITIYEDILYLIDDLKICAYLTKNFNSNLEKIQQLIDRLNSESYSNLDTWIAQLDKQIETVLIQRLQHAISAWTTEFIAFCDNFTDAIEPVFVNKVILIIILAVVCNLPRIQGSRNLVQQVKKSSASLETSYSNLLTKILDGSLEKAYDVIEVKLKEASEHINKWFQFQSLWDLEPNYIYDSLGNDLNKWKQILSEIKKSRTLFDNSEVEHSFGCIIVNYEQIQNKINARYDHLQLDVLNKFGIKLGSSMREFYSKVSNFRNELETKSMQNNNISETIALIIFTQDIKHKVSKWHLDIEIFRESQKILKRQRYQFPSDWLYIEQIEGEWSAFNEILDKTNYQIQEQIEIKNFVSDWNKNKPIGGEIKSNIAICILTNYKNRATYLKDEYYTMYQAKEILKINLTIEDHLGSILEEIRDLKFVWNSLSKIWQSINALKEIPWSLVMSQEIRLQLKNILRSIKELPSHIQSYSAFKFLEDTVNAYIKVNPILSELKSEAVKNWHWKQLFKALKLENWFNLSEMTVEITLLEKHKNEQIMKDGVAQTFGEMTLKECFTYLLFDNKIVGYIKSVLINTVHAIFNTKFIKLLEHWILIYNIMM
ncbi:36677_t:CDS:10 [Gigaspora margarita]|uniref:36677_t:CDS:1 n=1 Tax=Gigaspora margarita TaxID=4874 RepID=A0ABM8W6G8_GIGMA|nr:36677_t:CDS:10 [Gigaspora margarita]